MQITSIILQRRNETQKPTMIIFPEGMAMPGARYGVYPDENRGQLVSPIAADFLFRKYLSVNKNVWINFKLKI